MDKAQQLDLVREILASEDPRKSSLALATRYGLNNGTLWPLVREEAQRRAEERLPAEGLMERLLDDSERARLFADAAAERTLTLRNRLCDLLTKSTATPEQIRRLFAALPADGSLDSEVHWILYNPATPDSLLFDLLDQERCISTLGHRAGPQRLLELLVERHAYDEAIATLACDYYGRDDYPLDAFLAFIRRHGRCRMMAGSVQRSLRISEDRRRAAASVLDELDRSGT